MLNDLRIAIGLDASGFLTGMKSIEEQAAKGMAALQKAYQASSKAEKGLNDTKLNSKANSLRNLGVQEQEIQKFLETAKAVRAYKEVRASLREQYKEDDKAVEAGVAAFEKEGQVLSRATIAARGYAVAHQAALAKANYKISNSAPDESTNIVSSSNIVSSLVAEQAALGKTSAQLKVLELRSLGASEAQIATASAAQKAIDAYNREQKSLNNRNSMIGNSIKMMKNFIAATFAYSGASTLKNMADDWTTLNNRLKLVSLTGNNLIQVRSQLLSVSASTGQSIDATATLYQRLAQAQTQTKLSSEDMITVTQAITQAMVLGGGAAVSQEQALYQLGQALAKGKLDGDEFRAVMEEAPALSIALAKGLGVTKAQLIELSRSGKLTIDSLVESLLKVAPELSSQFSSTNRTIGQSLTSLKTKLVEFIGGIDEAHGISASFISGINSLANNLQKVGLVIELIASFYLKKYTAAMLTSILTSIKGVWSSTQKTLALYREAGAVGVLSKAYASLNTISAVAGWVGLIAGITMAISSVMSYTAQTRDSTSAMEEQIPTIKQLTEEFKKKNAVEQQSMKGKYQIKYDDAVEEYKKAIDKISKYQHANDLNGSGNVFTDIPKIQKINELINKAKEGKISAVELNKEIQKLQGVKPDSKTANVMTSFATDADKLAGKVNQYGDALGAMGEKQDKYKTSIESSNTATEQATKVADAARTANEWLAKGFKAAGEEASKAAQKIQELYNSEQNDLNINKLRLALMQQGLSESVASKMAKAQQMGMNPNKLNSYYQNVKQNEQIEKDIDDYSFVKKYVESLNEQIEAVGKSKDELAGLELAAHNANPEIIQMAIAGKSFVENQKYISDYVSDLQNQANDAQMEMAAKGSKDALIAMKLSARNASDATIRQAQAANKVIEAYERQKAVMTTLESLQDQVATLGMTETQRQLYELKKQKATPDQLAQAAQWLSQIDAFNKAQESSKEAADKLDDSGDSLKSAADKLKTGADSLKDNAKDKDKMTLSEQMRSDTSTYDKNRKGTEIGIITGAKTNDMDVTAQNVSLPNAEIKWPPVSGNLTGGLGTIGSLKDLGKVTKDNKPTTSVDEEGYKFENAIFNGAKFDNIQFDKNGVPAGAGAKGDNIPTKSYELILTTPDGMTVKGNYVTDKNFDAFLKNAIGRMARDK